MLCGCITMRAMHFEKHTVYVWTHYLVGPNQSRFSLEGHLSRLCSRLPCAYLNAVVNRARGVTPRKKCKWRLALAFSKGECAFGTLRLFWSFYLDARSGGESCPSGFSWRIEASYFECGQTVPHPLKSAQSEVGEIIVEQTFTRLRHVRTPFAKMDRQVTCVPPLSDQGVRGTVGVCMESGEHDSL